MKKIHRYVSWYDEPAVIINNGNKTYTGYYWRDWKWHTANAHQVGSFYGTDLDFDANGHELTEEEFISKFGDVLDKLEWEKL